MIDLFCFRKKSMMASSIEMLPECPVCLREMVPPMKIFQCRNGHALCEECKDNEHVRTCPSCRVTLEGDATRNILAEKMIEAAMSGMTTHDIIPSAPTSTVPGMISYRYIHLVILLNFLFYLVFINTNSRFTNTIF